MADAGVDQVKQGTHLEYNVAMILIKTPPKSHQIQHHFSLFIVTMHLESLIMDGTKFKFLPYIFKFEQKNQSKKYQINLGRFQLTVR